MPERRFPTWVAASGFCVLAIAAWAPAAEFPDNSEALEFFEKRVRPVLADKCLTCHEDLARGGLRLDSREALLKGGNLGPAIVPGDPEKSLLIQAVRHTHARVKMPMGGDKLREEEIRDLVAWVKMGAPWPEADSTASSKQAGAEFVVTTEHRAHWAFQRCHDPAIPEVRDTTWPKNSIDHFVLTRLEKEGLQPVRAADRRTLIRRAYFDLIGLPPTPQEIEAFERDNSPEAFAGVIDRLLSSAHYGERWGRHWLDVARYGEEDGRGLSTEKYANAWRYRDWVIHAFNEDMPYDVFLKAQIAGDLLPGVDNSKLVAGLGFLGLGPWYYDIAEPPLARANERDDRIDAISRGMLGLTVSCARCHNHKYDPISMKDYYALAGVFGNSQYHEYPLAPKEVVAAYERHQKKIREVEKTLTDFDKSQSEQLGEILARQSARYLVGAWRVIKHSTPAETVAHEEKLDGETLTRWVKYLGTPEKEHIYLAAWDKFLARDESRQEAERLAAEFQSTLLAILAEKKSIDEENRVIKAKAMPKRDPEMMKSLPNGFETYDEFCPGCLVALVPIAREKFVLWRDLLAEEHKSENPYERQGGILYFTGEQLDRFLAPAWKEHLASLRAELKALKDSAPPTYPFLHGTAEARRPSNLRLHLRGSPYKLGEEVPRRFLEVLSDGEPAHFERGSGRLELAEAIARHPIAARVMVNRIWHHHVGRGIVRTTSNFGRLGDRPSHPKLLEYLTARFLKGGGSLKALHREIMLSATYQLSCDDSAENLMRDPDNRLLWRANRRRLDVESIRDSLLFAAGKLDLTVGGPPAPLDTNNLRRTVYGKVSRFELDRLLALFDFPSPSASAELRNVTNVPIQWLFFMNSDFVWNQAESFAKRIQADGPVDDRAKIEQAYRILFGREPTTEEVRLGLEFLGEAVPANDKASPWTMYAQALLSSNEFLFVD